MLRANLRSQVKLLAKWNWNIQQVADILGIAPWLVMELVLCEP